MICDHVRHHIDSFVRGETSAEMSRDIESHIASCAACASEAELARNIEKGLRAMKRSAPEGLGARVIASTSIRQSTSRATWFAPSRAIAAAILISAVLWLTNEGRLKMMEPEMGRSVVEIQDQRIVSPQIENAPPSDPATSANAPQSTVENKAVAPLSTVTSGRQSLSRSAIAGASAVAPSMLKSVEGRPEQSRLRSAGSPPLSPAPSPAPAAPASSEAAPLMRREQTAYDASGSRNTASSAEASAPASRSVTAPATEGPTNGNVSDKDGYSLNEVNIDVSSQLSNDISSFTATDTFCRDTAPSRDTKPK